MSDALSGKDVIQLDQRIINDLADGDCVTLVPEEELAVVKAGKNGNRIVSYNEKGRQLKMTLRVILGSPDDKWLNSRLQEMNSDGAKYIALNGTFSKRVGDGAGNQATVVYQATFGFFGKSIDAKTNAEAETEQSVAVYNITFGHHSRSIQ